VSVLRRKGHGSHPTERPRQPGEHHKDGVKPDEGASGCSRRRSRGTGASARSNPGIDLPVGVALNGSLLRDSPVSACVPARLLDNGLDNHGSGDARLSLEPLSYCSSGA